MAARIGEFLERGADVRVLLEDGQLREGEDLAMKAREGRTADIVLVLFSRNSLPSRWPRAQWEDAFIHEPAAEGVRIGFAKWDDCNAPKVLAPMFVCEAPALRGLRRMKRWVRDRVATFQPPATGGAVPDESELEITGIAVADRPGSEYVESVALAYEFVRAYRGDFDEVFRLECAGRSVAALAGDLASQLSLRLEGDLESNLERLAAFCSAHRFLFLLEEGADEFIFGGRSSSLLIGESGPSSPDPLRTAQRVLRELSASWEEICTQARIGRRITHEQGRMAECFELMSQWHDAAETRKDRTVLDEAAREMVWILEAWGRGAEASHLEQRRAREYDEQMSLF
jgi:hypothetical protein